MAVNSINFSKKMNELIKLRQELHRNPELSNKEFETSERILKFVDKFIPDKIIKLGKTGLAFVFDSNRSGKTLVFRSELDALPILEKNKINYISTNEGVAHSCGHDGHMAILVGLAQKISENRPKKGKVVLLFQPAEEIEQGARDIINHPKFKELNTDFIFGLHNIPGIEKHKILIKAGSFSAASKAITLKIYGKTSHAAEPEKGISPANAISLLIRELHDLIGDKNQFSDFTILTIVHILLGKIAFGTSPGYAEMRVTYRAFENKDMDLLTGKAEKIIHIISEKENLKYEISYSEIFPATVNDKTCVDLVKTSAQENNLQIESLKKPFRWGEDFGYYTEKYKGVFFGIGSGINQAVLHNPDFDFPDEIIETGINVFFNIYKKLNF